MPVDDHNEQFYLVDKRDRPIGKIPRSKAHSSPQYIHRSICILVLNNKSQLLLQKRSKNKDTYPNFWTLSVTGHVTYGQTYLQAAKRELFEELGLKAPLKRLTKLLLSLPNETEYSTIYQTSIVNTNIVPDFQEISNISWVDISQLNDFSRKNLITPDALFVLRALKYL